jgi:hypothetical protein
LETALRAKASFSLFEILLVLSLLLIVVTITAPVGNFLGNFFLKSEVENLEVFCYYLQRLAMASGQEQVLTFDLQNHTYSCQKSKKEKIVHFLENGVRLGFIPGVFGPPAKPSKKIESPINGDKPGTQVKFLPNGKITSGSIYFVDRQNKNMGALTCSPSRVSYLRRYIYNGVNWVGL